MKKKTHIIYSFILLIFINGCVGYEPIFRSGNIQFKIADYSVHGNKILGNKIYSKLYSLSKSTKDDQNIRSINLVIEVSKDKQAKSKSSSGKILDYKITLNTKIKITDFVSNNEILTQNFSSSLTYKVQDQQSDTIILENKSIENLIDKIYQKLYIELSKNI